MSSMEVQQQALLLNLEHLLVVELNHVCMKN